MYGMLCIHKPPGPTSHDVVAGVRRRVGRGVKVGHAGTLDPFAEGVLVVCLGPATRLADRVQAQPKRYRATVHLGATSATDDPEGEIVPLPDAPAPPTDDDVRRAAGGFVGTVEQVPPAHSAVHVGGRRAYSLARSGQAVRLVPRRVTIHGIDVLAYAYPRVELDVRCGSGTHIRALARDLGEALGTGGYCAALTRTAVGAFDIADAVFPDALDPRRDLIPAARAVEHLPAVAAEGIELRRFLHGNEVSAPGPLAAGEVAVIDAGGTLVAIAEAAPDGRSIRPRKVFAPPV